DGPWVGELGRELTGQGAEDVGPWMAFPPAEKPPVAQVFVDADGDGRASCDLLGGPERRFQGGRPDGDDGPGAEITAHATGLFHAVGRETEAGRGADHEVVRVVDLGVVDEMDENCHAVSLALHVPIAR